MEALNRGITEQWEEQSKDDDRATHTHKYTETATDLNNGNKTNVYIYRERWGYNSQASE